MRIFDAFTFFNEIEILKMRLELHYPYVDRFYICESDHTFRGNPKKYILDDHLSDLSPWIDKISFIKHKADKSILRPEHVDAHMNFNSPAWEAEKNQRNALKICLEDSRSDDCIIVSDVDEFINPNLFSMLRSDCANQFDIARIEMTNHYYFMNCQAVGHNKMWNMPIVLKASKFEEIDDISSLRPSANIPLMFPNSGWHFSYLGGVDQIMEKISSFSHTEIDRPDIKNADHLMDCMLMGKDYIGRPGHEYAFYPVSSYPECIQNLMRKNKKFVRWSLT